MESQIRWALLRIHLSTPAMVLCLVVQVEGDVAVRVGGLAVDPCAQSGFASGHKYVQDG